MHAPLPLSDELSFVVIVPERDLATPEARGVLPDSLSRADAVFNLGRMGLLLAGLADASSLVPAATGDRIHQPARTALFPESVRVVGRARRGRCAGGELVGCGAEPSRHRALGAGG